MTALPHLRHPTPRRAPSSTGEARPRLQVVGRPAHTRRYLLAIMGVATAAIFGSVSLNAMAAEHSFTALELSNEVQELTLRSDELTVEIARLESPSRIRRVAREELGLVTPEEPGYLIVDGTTSAEFASLLGTMKPSEGRVVRASHRGDGGDRSP